MLKNIISKLKIIKYPYNAKISMEIPNEATLKKVALKDYVFAKGLKSQNYANIIKSKMPKGSEYINMTIKRQGIELIYEWEN